MCHYADNRQPQLSTSSMNPAKQSPQMASRSNQPFFHNAPDRQRPTDRQTDRQTDGGPGDKTCANTRLRSINDSDAANSTQVRITQLGYRKDDRAMRFCCAILQYRYDPAIKLLSSDVNKGAWQMPCRNYRPISSLPKISPCSPWE